MQQIHFYCLFILFSIMSPLPSSCHYIDRRPFGNPWCKFVSDAESIYIQLVALKLTFRPQILSPSQVQYMIVVTCHASVYTLVLMSLDRFLAVVHPISSISIRTQWNALLWVFPYYNFLDSNRQALACLSTRKSWALQVRCNVVRWLILLFDSRLSLLLGL